jgi:AcrR family transcriptional regulator
MAVLKTLLNPRKTPVQERSGHTVEVIFEATIQVLLQLGQDKLTTTKVAERAGVSVGTLYQYFPNKQALVAAVLERHLLSVVQAVEFTCMEVRGQTAETMARRLVGAFCAAKLKDAATSRALYSVAAEHGGAQVVARLTQRSQVALCDMLATCSDARFDDLRTLSFVLSTSMIGPVQALLNADMQSELIDSVQMHLQKMASAYLYAFGRKASPPNADAKDLP